jgi:Fur family transcriptional regulator, ferric uptake regulator
LLAQAANRAAASSGVLRCNKDSRVKRILCIPQFREQKCLKRYIIKHFPQLTLANMSNSPTDLKASGLKATLPRLKILDIFQSSPVRHLTAEDVYKLLLAENMDVGLATVYRVLTQFEQAGLLNRNHFESGKAIFELNEGSHHDHLVCLDCGRVEEFVDEEIEKRQQSIAAERGFKIAEHALAIYGSCTKVNCPHKH